MKLLIDYATTDGQTRKVARFCADRIAASGHTVELLNVEDAEGLDLTRFEGAILAGSLHAGGFQKPLAAFAKAQAEGLAKLPTLFLPVSLSAAGDDPEDWAGLKTCVERFLAEAAWVPGQVTHVAGAFRFTQYDFFRSWAMKRIADAKGEVVDTHADKEYTDWDALGHALDGWVAGVAQG